MSNLNTYLKSTLSKPLPLPLSPKFLSSVALYGDGSRQTLACYWEHSVINILPGFSQLRRAMHKLRGIGEIASARVCRKLGTILERSGTFLAFSRMELFLLPRMRRDRFHLQLWLLGESTLPELCLEVFPNINIAPKWHLQILLKRLISMAPKRRQNYRGGVRRECCIQITLIWSWRCLGRKH